ncbi:MAG: alpha-glucan family phosphorylase [Anaerolineae bacterium]|nr:alpha-glucan family phosphorylase [Anaerolineae bacterium]
MDKQIPSLDSRSLPPRIERLRELAYNLWWSWHEEAQDLYCALDPLLWEETEHNPVALLRRIDTDKLEAAVTDVAYLANYDKVFRTFDFYMGESDTWFATTYPDIKTHTIAYFSTEFGLHESLPLYAGGLGVLSGDHTKEASDLGLPFVGVGLLYHMGYFTQKINADGWQEDIYSELDPDNRPIKPVLLPDGQPAQVSLDLGTLQITSKLWKVQVGRVPIYLLDTDLESSDPDLTNDIPRLYGGSHLTRLLQEILLGVGGVKALRFLDINPQIWHMNEGHSSFLTLELIREHVVEGMSVEQAANTVKNNTVFTTHTPVPAGLDMFDVDLITPYFQPLWEEIGISREQFIDFGRQDIGWGEKFSMPRLALQLSGLRNGVSELHGQVSRDLFQSVWPDRKIDEVPIFHITNGVHARTWLAPQMISLFDRYIGRDWIYYMDDPSLWDALDAIPDQVLWSTRQEIKIDLLRFLRYQARVRWAAGETTPAHIAWSGTLFHHDVLTIGFARRFATYKRATLIFHDFERLREIVRSAERPVQFVFAGKAHPQDHGGKMLIQELCRRALDPQLAGRIAFLEDYDMNVARYLVRGVDVWLNNPRRPREASGTSGQKAALNGIPNLSILDGWWAEGFNGHNGWAIGNSHAFWAEHEEDRADAEAFYEVLEKEVIPLYYQRTDDDLPQAWLTKVREAVKSAIPYFSTRRMVKEYAQRMYVPSIRQREQTDRELWIT